MLSVCKASLNIENEILCCFFQNFWECQKAKDRDEREKNSENILERFTYFLRIISKVPGNDAWKKRIMQFDLRVCTMVMQMELYDDAVNRLENIKKSLQSYRKHDEVGKLSYMFAIE